MKLPGDHVEGVLTAPGLYGGIVSGMGAARVLAARGRKNRLQG